MANAFVSALGNASMSTGVNDGALTQRLPPALRSPRRITITLPFGTHAQLVRRSAEEGRSLHNLATFLLESAMGEAANGH